LSKIEWKIGEVCLMQYKTY